MLTLSQFFRLRRFLPGCLQNHESKESFVKEFKQLFGSKAARDAKNVLYVFVCEYEMPRVKSANNIIYIGKTVQTLTNRWMGHANAFVNNFNWPFYSYILEHYGKVRIAYLPFDTKQSLKQAEAELLNNYHKLHKDYPPQNAQRR